MLSLNIHNLRYICKNMMNVDWFPEMEDEDEVLEVLNLCDSILEGMGIRGIGKCYYDKLREEIYARRGYSIVLSKRTIKGQDGICFFPLYMEKHLTYQGPFGLIAVPQYRSPVKNIRHDIGIYLSVPDVRMRSDTIEIFSCAVEVDGYQVHRNRRRLDEKRIENLTYPVIRVLEEQTEPTKWFRQYIEEFDRLLHNDFFWASVPQWRGREIECPACGETAYELDFVCENCFYKL